IRILPVALLALAAVGPALADTTDTQRQILRAEAQSRGSVRVIAHLDSSTVQEHLLAGPAEIQRQRRHLALDLDGLRRRMSARGLRHFDPIDGLPAGVMELDAGGLEQLLADPAVKHVSLDRRNRPLLQDSVPLVHA